MMEASDPARAVGVRTGYVVPCTASTLGAVGELGAGQRASARPHAVSDQLIQVVCPRFVLGRRHDGSHVA
jgi:hypothetical protein